LNKVEVVLITLNAIFGLIQITLSLFLLDLSKSFAYVLLSIVFFVIGYHTIIKPRFKEYNAHLIFAGILLVGNLVFLAILGLDTINNSGNLSIVLDFAGFMCITFGDFEEFGNLIGRIREVKLSAS
jgi:hypothetical protein